MGAILGTHVRECSPVVAAFGGVAIVQLLAFWGLWRTAIEPAATAQAELEAYQNELQKFVKAGCAALGQCEQGDLTARMSTDSDDTTTHWITVDAGSAVPIDEAL